MKAFVILTVAIICMVCFAIYAMKTNADEDRSTLMFIALACLVLGICRINRYEVYERIYSR